jgi:peptidoglycan/LPS O-acetylase OafA/YrhL
MDVFFVRSGFVLAERYRGDSVTSALVLRASP